MKINKSKRIKFISLTLGLATLVTMTSLVVTSCGPSAAAINALYPTSSSNGFVNSPNVTTNDIVIKSLIQSSGFEAFLKTKLSDVLSTWYKNNANSSIRAKYQNFVDVIDNDWKNLINDLKKSHGNDYLVELQKSYLDQNGGTEATYKQTKLNEKILDDFSSSLFSTLYLSYVQGTQSIIPSKATLDDPTNWTNLKFTNPVSVGYVSDEPSVNNVNETYAQIQGSIFSYWVNEENPNLLSSVLFSNGAPRNSGLEMLFNKDVIGADTLTPSYAFQAIENNLSDLTSSKGAAAYKKIVTDGLDKYVDLGSSNGGGSAKATATGKIDFSTNLTQGTTTKTLMTSSEMLSGSDISIPTAFIQQYLTLINDTKKDNIGAGVVLSGTSSSGTGTVAAATEKDFNVMNNFIRVVSSTASTAKQANADPETAYTKVNPQFTNAKNNFTNEFYDVYKHLVPTTGTTPSNTGTTYGIYNVVKPVKSAQNGTQASATTTDPYNNFILIRADDGIHLMGIDGGSYYLSNQNNNGNNGTTNNWGRDVTKQQDFLKYRAALLTWGNLPTDLTYEFNLKDSLSTWFNKNKTRVLFNVLSDALDHKNAFANTTQNGTNNQVKNFFDLSANAQFKTEFQQLKTDISDYVQKYEAYAKVLSVQTNVNSLCEKLNTRAKTYSDYESNLTPEKIGIAARLPYVRQNDGVYAGLADYYTNGVINDSSSSNSTTNVSELINQKLEEVYKDLETSTKSMVQNMDLKILDKKNTPFSEVLFIKSNKNSLYDLAINSSLQTNINTSAISNVVKYEYFKNNTNFNNIYNLIEGTNSSNNSLYGIDKTRLTDVINTYYWMPVWYGSSNKYSYGGFQDQSGLDKIISRVKSFQSISTNPTNDSAISYYTYLYTLDWLLRDDLANFKFILNQSFFEGTNAAITWTMNTNPANVTTTTNDPFTTFAANPNFLQGSATNWYNATSSATNETTPSSKNSTTPPTPDPFNNTGNPYFYTNTAIKNGASGSTTTPTKFYGFNGIVFENNSGIDANVSSQLFSNFGSTGIGGSLSAFGSREHLLNYVNRIQTLSELDNLVSKLETRAKIDFSTYHQKDADGKFIMNFDQKKELVISKIPTSSSSGSSDDYYKKFVGFIGNTKAEYDFYNNNSTNGQGRMDALKKSDPVVESGSGKLTRVAAYVRQINYEDANNLGGQNWTASPDTASTNRLNLDLNTFLAIIAMQASNSSIQSLATNDLINSNAKPSGSSSTRFTVGDKRLFDSLTNTWVTKPKN